MRRAAIVVRVGLVLMIVGGVGLLSVGCNSDDHWHDYLPDGRTLP